MAELLDVAKIWKQKSAQAIYPGFPYPQYNKTRSSKAFKTGNLLRKFVQANSDNRMIETKMRSSQFVSYELELDIAPTGAEYGKFVHNGTIKMEARPYAKIGFEKKEVQDKIDDFLSGLVGAELQKYKDILKNTLSNLK
jgi:hypothetical protein